MAAQAGARAGAEAGRNEVEKQLQRVRASEQGLAELAVAQCQPPCEEVCLAAVQSFPRAVRFLSSPSDAVQRAAVAGDPQTILLIPQAARSAAACLEAARADPGLMRMLTVDEVERVLRSAGSQEQQRLLQGLLGAHTVNKMQRAHVGQLAPGVDMFAF